MYVPFDTHSKTIISTDRESAGAQWEQSGERRDFIPQNARHSGEVSLRRLTDSQERIGKKKSACSVPMTGLGASETERVPPLRGWRFSLRLFPSPYGLG